MLNEMLLFAATASEWDPEPGFTPDPNTVTPGVIGFAVIALIAAAVFVLGWDLNRRVRRLQFREEAQEKIAAEVAAMEAEQSGAAESGATAEPAADQPAADHGASEHDK